MRTKRTTSAVILASIHDPDICTLKKDVLERYAKNRDLKQAGISEDGVIAETGKRVIIIHVRPVTYAWAHVCDMQGNIGSRILFKKCVTKIVNMDDVSMKFDDEKELSDDTIEQIGMDIIEEIAQWIREQWNGKDGSDMRPFLWPAGWLQAVSHQRALLALSATTGNASE